MATHAGRLTQDQNFNVHFDGSLVGGKNNGCKAQKKGGGLTGRKALNDISNSGKPSALQPSRKHNSLNVISIGEDLGVPKKASAFKTSEKAQVGGRKALGDLTNSGKPSGQNILKKKNQDKKLLAVAEEEKFPNAIADERFLHNHHECIKSQRNAVDRDYFMKTIGLDDDISVPSLAPRSCSQSRKYKVGQDDSPVKVFEMEELPELMTEDRTLQCKKLNPVFGSPNSPKPPYMQLKDYDLPNFILMESPKLLKY